MSSAVRQPASALLGLVLALVFAPGSASAHTRSQSFSTWDVRGQGVVAVFSAPIYEATRLVPLAPDADQVIVRRHQVYAASG